MKPVTTDDLVNACLRVAAAFTLADMRESEAAEKQDRDTCRECGEAWPPEQRALDIYGHECCPDCGCYDELITADAYAEMLANEPPRPTPAARMNFYLDLDTETDTDTMEG